MRNLLNSLSTATRHVMAGLLLSGALCAPLSGCLIPQDNPVLIDIPPRANRPIRIEDNSPAATQVKWFLNETACIGGNAPFSLTVVDDDTADIVDSYWFIDKNKDSLPFRPSPIAGGSRQRTVTAPTSLNFRSALSGLSPGTHLLTVFVADTAFQEYDGAITTASRDTFLADGGVVYLDRSYI
ncbi:MAG TPA: hypothetical protein VGD87_05065, partial [Archangium sp.]